MAQAFDTGQIVRGKKHGAACPGLLSQLGFDHPSGFGIERFGWFVKHDHRSAAGDGLREYDLPLHTVTQFSKSFGARNAERVQKRQAERVISVRMECDRECQQLLAGHLVIECRLTRCVTDMSPCRERITNGIGSTDANASLIGSDDADHGSKECAFTGPVRSDQSDNLASLNPQRNTLQHLLVAEGVGDVVEKDSRLLRHDLGWGAAERTLRL